MDILFVFLISIVFGYLLIWIDERRMEKRTEEIIRKMRLNLVNEEMESIEKKSERGLK